MAPPLQHWWRKPYFVLLLQKFYYDGIFCILWLNSVARSAETPLGRSNVRHPVEVRVTENLHQGNDASNHSCSPPPSAMLHSSARELEKTLLWRLSFSIMANCFTVFNFLSSSSLVAHENFLLPTSLRIRKNFVIS